MPTLNSELSTLNTQLAVQRLDQLLANLGYGSRREVRTLVETGRVTVLGRPASHAGEKVSAAEVRVDGAPLDHPDGLLLMLHKPVGLVCSHDEREGVRVYDLLPARWLRRNPPLTSIGRLDKETSGLLLLTDRSALVHQLTAPRNKIPKTYLATLDREAPAVEAAAMTALFAGGELQLSGEDKPCAPAELRWRGPRLAEITVTEGRYHQVRRMFAARGCEVVALHRTRLGRLELGELPAGEWRELPLDTFHAAGGD